MKKNKNESGIALLVGLLIMSLALVVVVQTVSNVAVPDVEISSGEEASSRAFSAAEAGIERALLQGGTVNQTYTNENTSFNATISEGGQGTQFNYPKKLSNAESATFWFVSHDSDDDFTCSSRCYTGNFNIYWNEVTSDRTAVEVTIYYDPAGSGNFTSGNFSNVRTARYAFDRNGSRGNAFTPVNSNCSSSCTISDSLGNARTYAFVTPTITPPCSGGACILMVRVRSLYNTNPVAVGIRAAGALPSQVKQAVSVGTAGSQDYNRAVRRIEAYQSYPEPLPIFDAALIAPNSDIVKN